MSEQKNQTRDKLNGYLTDMWIVLDRLEKSVSLLRRCNEREVSLPGNDMIIIRIALTHFIVNNLHSIFNNNRRDANSLLQVPKRFEAELPNGFFSECIASVKEFRRENKADLERIKKNRDLSTGHLSVSREEQLGWDSKTARKIEEIYGTKTRLASEDSLIFITQDNILNMPIIQNFPQIGAILEELQTKLFMLE